MLYENSFSNNCFKLKLSNGFSNWISHSSPMKSLD